MAKKDDLKELKQPDEFQKLGEQAVPFLEQHGQKVAIAVGAILVAALVIGVASSMGSKNDETAAQEFGKALMVLDREVSETAEAKPGGEPPFKTQTEKDEAIVTTLSAFRTTHSGSKGAVSAALPLAQAKLRLGKPEEALPLVDEFLAKADSNDPLRPAAYEARGYALEAQKKYDDALAAFDQLARENKTDFMKGMGLYHRARMLLLKGDTAGGAKTLSEIPASAPDTAAARLAKERISLLTSQGVEVPQVVPAVLSVDAGS